MNQNIIPVEAIQERDIDLILLEELSTDLSFCDWFISELGLPKLSSRVGAWRSITDFGLGETDILFSYTSENLKINVLIENKLDASFQDEQYGRYAERASKYQSTNECDIAYCVLTAPQEYCDNQNDFEYYISYENIAQRLENTGSERGVFKCNLLKIAIEKLRRGYQPVNSLPVQRFWNSYWEYKESNYPSLYMKKPGIVPHQSDWPMLNDKRLKNIVFYHKFKQGNVDATFQGFPKGCESEIAEILPDWANIQKHGKSFSIRVFSGVIDRTKDFNSQLENVENGLKNIERIRNWILENEENLKNKLGKNLWREGT
jgi:hypothetical protein